MIPVERHVFSRIASIFFFFTLLFCSPIKDVYAAQAVTESPTCISRGWPQDISDLQPDPKIRFGSLENGFRYAIMENHEPKNRAGLYLDVQAGSLNEKEEQRGLAHFLEHMLFNGTTNYPPGTLVEYFQSIGMSFGADTNAMTNFTETVYNILLPDGKREHLDQGLQVMADYARGALLLEDEVDKERGIILAEKRTRDSAGYRLYQKKTQFFFAGTRVPERLPIGTEKTLEKADSELLRNFYDAWYRPENMILVVVGDVDPATAEELITDHFAKFSNPQKEPACYNFGRVDEKGTDVLYVHEPELGYTEVSINTRWNETPTGDSKANQSRELKEYVADSLLGNRLKKIVNRPGSPITEGQAYSGIFLQQVGYASVTARTEAEKWQESLELLNMTLRQALAEGFTETELDRVKKDIAADLEKQVKTEGSRDSRKLARDIIAKLNSNEVFLSPEQEHDLYTPMLASLTIDEINGVFKKLWSHDNRQVFVGGTANIAGSNDGEEAVRKAYVASLQQKVSTWTNGKVTAFPYLPVSDVPPEIAEQKDLSGIGAQQVRFANGTVLNIKQTDFQPNEVLMSVHFGHGRLAEPREGLAMLAEALVNESAYGQLTKNQLDDALAGKNVQLSFNIGEESFQLNGGALTGEFELLLQMVQTQLLDPAFREDAYRLVMDRFRQMYDQLQNSVEGVMQLRGERFLAGGNIHYGLPPQEKIDELTLSQVEQWLVPVFRNAQLEVDVVGDISPDKVIALSGRYLGNMTREKTTEEQRVDIVFPSAGKMAERVDTSIDKALVVVAWPTDDFWDISQTRRLNVLASVLDDRLRVEIREKLGAVYSPVVYNMPSRVAKGYGVMRSIMTVDPAQSGIVADKVREVAGRLADSGIQEDELHRALEPTLTSIKDMMRTNRYWLQSVLALSSRHPEQLRWPLSIQSDFASITAEEVGGLAAHYLQPDNSAEVVISPIGGKERSRGSSADKP